MEFNELSKLTPYVITKSSSDRSLAVGDIFFISSNNDMVIAGSNGGVFDESEWKSIGINDFEAQVSDHYAVISNDNEEQIISINKISGGTN